MPGSGLGFGTGLGLRPIQTECDSTTQREFSVLKKKQNRQRIKISQDMQTK